MINIVVALLPEARPLIDYFKLKQTEKEPYALYENGDIRLILSGIGKLNAACAVTSLHHLRPVSQDEAWLNIGLAGHPDFDTGTGSLASKISDPLQRRVFYPAFIFKTPHRRTSLLSLDQPSHDYIPNTLFDMEAFGYYFAAIKYALVERIHVYKIISDNLDSSYHQITPKKAEQFIGDHLSCIEGIIGDLSNLVPSLQEHPELPEFLKSWKFSETQQHSLKRILNILFCQEPNHSHFDLFHKITHPKELLGALELRLQKVPL